MKNKVNWFFKDLQLFFSGLKKRLTEQRKKECKRNRPTAAKLFVKLNLDASLS